MIKTFQITRRSPLTGKENTITIKCTREQMARYVAGDGLIQDVFPHLSNDEREFMVTGYTPEDWKKIFPDEED